MSNIRFGPSGLGSAKTAIAVLEQYHKLGIRTCEITFTYGVYIKEAECEAIRKKAEELNISLSVHSSYYVNLNAEEKAKREATKKRILECCKIGELLGAKTVVFHPGYYGSNREKAFETIKQGVKEMMEEIKRNGWKIKIAAETMGKINVFGSLEEIRALVNETGCSFCLDFAHILARYKKVDYALVEKMFPESEWHVHFSGIEYGEKGEKNHIMPSKEEWKNLLENIPKDKEITIVSESPLPVEDCVEGMKILNSIGKDL